MGTKMRRCLSGKVTRHDELQASEALEYNSWFGLDCRKTRRRLVITLRLAIWLHEFLGMEPTYSGGTAPDLHRIPHLFPVRATDFPERNVMITDLTSVTILK